jgi:hypothetical protein
MNKKRNILFAGLLLAAAVIIPGCADEDPVTPSDDRDKLVDGWTCNETSTQAGSSTYTILISKSTTNTAEVLLENFYDIGNQHKARVSVSGNTLTIPQQLLNGNQLNGSGAMSGNNAFTLTYYINNGSSIDTCTATCTRQ